MINWKKLSKHPLWSKVIAGLIVFAITSILIMLFRWVLKIEFVNEIFKLDFLIPSWIFILVSLILLLFLILIFKLKKEISINEYSKSFDSLFNLENSKLSHEDIIILNKLNGIWFGVAKQLEYKHLEEIIDIEMHACLELYIEKNVIKGTLTYTPLNLDGLLPVKAYIVGYLFRSRFLKIEFRDQVLANDRFGYLLLKISSNKRELVGEWISYGSSMNKMVGGPINVTFKN